MAKRIEIQSMSCFYGSFKAVEDVTLSVEPKSVTAFIGPSGCGKSTVLRALNRLHEVTPGAYVTGRVLLDDDDIYGPGVDPVQVRRTIGMVFQRPNPFPTMSVRDNVVAGPGSGTRSRTGCTGPAPACPADSSSGCASPGRSPWNRRCCSWTSPARR